jgi:hypothetical protein
MDKQPTHRIKIGVSNKSSRNNIVRCRRVTLRERILRWIFGDLRRVTIIVPSDNVRDITIQEAKPDGTEN